MNAHQQAGDAKRRTDIPAELVWPHSFDAFTAELGDPFAAISRLHEGPALVWSADASYGRPGWIATRHAVMAEVFMDHQRFSAERPGMIADLLGVNLRLNPIEIDPPAHHHYRRILQPCFTPMAVKAIDASVREACNALITAFADAGRCEFVHDFAIPFPSYVFLDLMGMPRAMVGDFIAWEDALMRGRSMEARI
jgi:cytochrome P450